MNATVDVDVIAQMIADAGGLLVGRTRLQKLGYLLHATGFDKAFRFEYKHYGPFSERLAEATQLAELFGDVEQDERATDWGGSYFVFKVKEGLPKSKDRGRLELISIAAKADAVELELAATAVFLAKSGHPDPWRETQRRKPEKATGGGLNRSKALYKRLQTVSSPVSLPTI